VRKKSDIIEEGSKRKEGIGRDRKRCTMMDGVGEAGGDAMRESSSSSSKRRGG
jgi:hypothetical protein